VKVERRRRAAVAAAADDDDEEEVAVVVPLLVKKARVLLLLRLLLLLLLRVAVLKMDAAAAAAAAVEPVLLAETVPLPLLLACLPGARRDSISLRYFCAVSCCELRGNGWPQAASQVLAALHLPAAW